MQIESQTNLTRKHSTVSPVNPLILWSKDRRSRSRGTENIAVMGYGAPVSASSIVGRFLPQNFQCGKNPASSQTNTGCNSRRRGRPAGAAPPQEALPPSSPAAAAVATGVCDDAGFFPHWKFCGRNLSTILLVLASSSTLYSTVIIAVQNDGESADVKQLLQVMHKICCKS